MRFWVWYHYWPWSSQLVAQFANWQTAKMWTEWRNETNGSEYTIVDTSAPKPVRN